MIKWQKFTDMTGLEVYEVFLLRQQVFMLEQDCLYQDIDRTDIHALHCRYLDDNQQLLGYLRILPPADAEELTIGRLAVRKKFRRSGIATEMMKYALDICQQHFPNSKIRLAAQSYLIEFYRSLGFTDIGPSYMEDDIPHQDMHLLNNGKIKI